MCIRSFEFVRNFVILPSFYELSTHIHIRNDSIHPVVIVANMANNNFIIRVVCNINKIYGTHMLRSLTQSVSQSVSVFALPPFHSYPYTSTHI